MERKMREVKVEQILFGYDNGHGMLYSSLKKPLIQQREVERLSDASGNGIFDSYISCFPLVEDEYYVFAKTWYADEMQRPGCVWTHMLLISFDDLEKNMGTYSIQSLFHRPDVHKNENVYQITCMAPSIEEIRDSHYYEYIIYTLFYSDKKALIGDGEAEKYEEGILDILSKLPVSMLKNITICTCSNSNRYINNNAFSYQITPQNNLNLLHREQPDVIVYKNINEIEEFPLWVKYVAEKFRRNQQMVLYEYSRLYSDNSRLFLREFSKLLYAVNEFLEQTDLENFLNMAERLIIKEKVIERTLELLFFEDVESFEMNFTKKSIVGKLVVEMQSKEGIFVKKKLKPEHVSKQAKRIYKESDKKKIGRLFEKYIHKRLNDNAEKIMQEIVTLLQPEDLKEIFGMNENICLVILRMNPNLLMCADIWKQKRDYQLEMLNCVKGRTVENQENMLGRIIDNTREDIGQEVYEIFGNSLVCLLYVYCKKGRLKTNEQIKIWGKYLMKDSSRSIEFLKEISDARILISLMKEEDSYQISSIEEMGAWIDACENNMVALQQQDGYIVSFFLLPLCLKTKRTRSALSQFVYETIYHKLEQSKMEYEQWKKIDILLPELPVEQSWDKCLRLKMAFENIDY